jgi:DNA-binding Lrp family transcriptional regulator
MNVRIPDISKQIYKEDIVNVLENKYSILGPMWVTQQMEWMSGVYSSYKDHDKFLIVIFLVKKTLDFYSRNFIKLNYEEFYSRDTVEIEKFTISEISIALNIPKESTRRKVHELENEGTIKKVKKKLIIDRSKLFKSKPVKSIQRVSRFFSLLSEMCEKEKILTRKISSEELELTLKKNFSYTWKIYYELQIPMMINYKKIFKDLETFHIFGICAVNQHLYLKKISNESLDRDEFLQSINTSTNMQGINAMSLSDISGIPRATVIRKLKKLVKGKILSIDDKKHYRLTGYYTKNLIPAQKKVFHQLAIFSASVYNLAIYEGDS